MLTLPIRFILFFIIGSVSYFLGKIIFGTENRIYFSFREKLAYLAFFTALIADNVLGTHYMLPIDALNSFYGDIVQIILDTGKDNSIADFIDSLFGKTTFSELLGGILYILYMLFSLVLFMMVTLFYIAVWDFFFPHSFAMIGRIFVLGAEFNTSPTAGMFAMSSEELKKTAYIAKKIAEEINNEIRYTDATGRIRHDRDPYDM